MQTMSTEMAALLKSKKMIGDNKPVAQVILGGQSGGGYDFKDITSWTAPRTIIGENLSGSATRGNMAETSDGRAIAIYIRDNSSIEKAFADSVMGVLDGTTPFGVGTTIATGYVNSDVAVELIEGKLRFSVSFGSDPRTGDYQAEWWEDEDGTGANFSKVADIGGLHSAYVLQEYRGYQQTSNPIKLDNGNILVILPYYNNTAIRCCAFYSTDMGLTWNKGAELTGDFSSANTSRNIYDLGEGKTVSYIYGNEAYIAELDNSGQGLTKHYCGGGWNSFTGYSVPVLLNFADIGGKLICIAPDSNLPIGIRFLKFKDGVEKIPANMAIAESWESIHKVYHSFASRLLYTVTQNAFVLQENIIGTHIRAYGTEIEYIENVLQPKSIQISRAKGMAGSLTVEFDNKNGVLAPDGETNPALLWPNKEVVVKQGYGSELIQTFTGLIDSISMSRDPDKADISISVRDKMKPLLDHYLRNAEFLYTLTYTNMTVEHIWENLMILAGVEYNIIEETGLTISEKQFSWETYGDAISWLDEISGFQTYCDEFGKMNFVRDGRPVDATPVYSFVEGVDIISLGYDIDDKDLYYSVAVYGRQPAVYEELTEQEIEDGVKPEVISEEMVIYFARQFPQAEYWNIPSGKVMRIDAPDADTQAKCEQIADKAIYLMQTRARKVQFESIGIPHLQIGDFIQVTESSTTISEIYRITDISTTQSDGQYTMNLSCYYHAAPEVV